jgi:hypothetical protein
VKNRFGVLVLGLVIGGVIGWAWERHQAAPTFSTPFQAVLLDTGQVYYGKLEGLGTDYPVLREVYYIQTGTDPQTKQTTNVLIRRGKEWHGPEFTVLNARHIALIEPVSPGSKVAGLIADQEKQGK